MPNKKEIAKEKAIKGGMPQNVADKVFKMKSPEVAYMAKIAGSPAMEMGYKDKVMKMDSIVDFKKIEVSDTKEFSSAGISPHSEREFSKRSGKPLPYRKSKGYGQDEMVTKDNIPVETVVSKITGKSYDDYAEGRFGREGQTERHMRVEGTRDKFREIGKKKFGLKPSESAAPMMFRGQIKKALDTTDPKKRNEAKIAKKRAELKAGYGNKVIVTKVKK